MKFRKKIVCLIIHFLLNIKITDSENITISELSGRRKLQSNISEEIYDIYITGYSYYLYYINLFFYSEPQIPDNLNFTLLINIDKYIYSKIYETKEIELKAINNDTNKLTAKLNNIDLLDAYDKSNFLFITLKNLSIESTNKNNIYNLHLFEVSFNVIPLNFDINKNYYFDYNPSIPEVKSDYVALNKIRIIGYDIIDNQLILYTYFENATNDDIYFLIKLNIDSFNTYGNYWQREEINIKTIYNIEKNKYTAIIENLNINEIETHTKITLIEINAESITEDTIYYVDSSQITFDIKPFGKIVSDMTNLANINQNIYNIYFTKIYLDDNEIHLITYSEPEINDNMNYVVSIYLVQYNSLESYWERKKNVLNITNNIKGTNEFILNLDNINLDVSQTSITITNIKEGKSDENNIYYIHFPIKTFNIEIIENTIQNSIIQTTIFYNTDINAESDSFNIISPIDKNAKNSSKKLSTGALIGIILGVIIVLSDIIFIIVKFFCINPKIANFLPTDIQKMNKSSENLTDTIKSIIVENPDINKRSFSIQIQAQNQIQNYITIESKKTMKDLRKSFFEEIKRIDLFEEEGIYFLSNGRNFTIESNEIIETIFKDYEHYIAIVVIDNEDKINKTCPKTNNKLYV